MGRSLSFIRYQYCLRLHQRTGVGQDVLPAFLVIVGGDGAEYSGGVLIVRINFIVLLLQTVGYCSSTYCKDSRQTRPLASCRNAYLPIHHESEGDTPPNHRFEFRSVVKHILSLSLAARGLSCREPRHTPPDGLFHTMVLQRTEKGFLKSNGYLHSSITTNLSLAMNV